jgi:signal transduction histidine kinase
MTGVTRLHVQERVVALACMVAVALGLLLAQAVLPGGMAAFAPALAAGAVAQLAATAALAWLPSRPHLALAAVLLVVMVLATVAPPWPQLIAVGGVPWVPLAVAWSAVRVMSGARSPRQLQVSAGLAVVYLAVMAGSAPRNGLSALFSAALPLIAGVSVVLAMRLRTARADRAAALAAERDTRADLARAAERQRVAAALHDTLGHVLTLVVLNANLLTSTAADDTVREAGVRISGLGARGLGELRRALDLIDPQATGEAPPEPDRELAGPPAAPAGSQLRQRLQAIAEEAQCAGQDVAFGAEGTIPSLDPARSAAVQRALREGLTNARKHAPSSPVRASLAAGDGQVRLTVANDAPPRQPAAAPGPGSGRGLAALQRGITLLGGSCSHGTTPGGGYTLAVQLPAYPAEAP